MRSITETDLTTLRALRGCSLQGIRALYQRTPLVIAPIPMDTPAGLTASRLSFVKSHALLALRKSHRGIGCLRARD
jgi:hypothetical protein